MQYPPYKQAINGNILPIKNQSNGNNHPINNQPNEISTL